MPIIRGLDNIVIYLKQQEYHGRKNKNYVRGTRRDVWWSINKRDAEKRKIARLERELEDIRREQEQARANYLMHMAMGCDDRDCREC